MVAGITVVRDELDILPYTLERMRKEVDALLVIDHHSADGTFEYLQDYGAGDDNVMVIEDSLEGFDHAALLTDLARRAVDLGADWVVPFDADEVWRPASLKLRLADVLGNLDSQIAEAHVFEHVRTAEDTDADIVSPLTRTGWRRPKVLPKQPTKVAGRAYPGMTVFAGGHGVSYAGRMPRNATHCLEVRHFQFRNPEQMVRKIRSTARELELAGVGEQVSWHIRAMNKMPDNELHRLFFERFWSDDPQGDGLVWDPA